MEKAKAIVVINESHDLMSEQEQILNKRFESFERLNVPATGWTLEQIEREVDALYDMWIEERDVIIVFASPIPAMIKSTLAVIDREFVLIFHNDNREKVELPNGKIIFKVAREGWQLV